MVKNPFQALKKRFEREGYQFCIYDPMLKKTTTKPLFNFLVLKINEKREIIITIAKIVKSCRFLYLNNVLNKRMREMVNRLQHSNVKFEIFVFLPDKNYKYTLTNGVWQLKGLTKSGEKF